MRETLKYTTTGDVLIFNIGHHYTRIQRFVEWVAFVDELAAFLKEVKDRTGAIMVMRTTFYLKENAVRSFNTTKYPHVESAMLINQYVPPAIYNTEARRMLFDSYAEHAFSKVRMAVMSMATDR